MVLGLAGAAIGIKDVQRTTEQMYAIEYDAVPHLAESLEIGPSSDAKGNLLTPAQAHGRFLFGKTCFSCHGMAGAGLPNQGANLRDSKFVQSHTDAELVKFVHAGRLPTDPDSLHIGTMPPNGANPDLKDEDILDLLSIIRTWQPGYVAPVAAAGATTLPAASASVK